MTVRDLGRFDAPVLVFGGPYGNLQATQALLAEAGRRGIPPARMLCTGDVVAYCADMCETVALIREAGIAVVMGNVEESLGRDAADCGCGFAAGSTCDALAERWYAHAVAALDDDAKRWMHGLPRRIDFTVGGRRLAAIHGGVAAINSFIFPKTPAALKARELDLLGADIDGVICGHSGLPFTEVIGDRLWHNAGVIGLPANDGTPRVWYSLLSPTPDGLRIEHHALGYDHDAAAARLSASGLPVAYALTLETGLWPSDDIMPKADQARQGRPLAPAPVFWPHRQVTAARRSA